MPTHEFYLVSGIGPGDLQYPDGHIVQNLQALQVEAQQDYQKCNTLQRPTVDTVMECITSNNPTLFFLDGPGRTGKTFVENLLLNTIHAEGDMAITVASSGIAATLLNSGRTAHSTLKIPISIDKDSY